MSLNNDENRKKISKFNSDEIVLALKIVKDLEQVVELMYHMMEHEGSDAFVLMLITAKDIELKLLLDNQKRKTDMLFEIDKDKALYAMLCQDTQVDGGYHFGERLIKSITSIKGNTIYCSALEVRSTKMTPKSVFFKLIEMLIKSKQEKKIDEVVYKSIN